MILSKLLKISTNTFNGNIRIFITLTSLIGMIYISFVINLFVKKEDN